MKNLIKFILIGDRKIYNTMKKGMIGFAYPILGDFVVLYFQVADRIYDKIEALFD